MIICLPFFRTGSGLGIFHCSVWSIFNLYHSSRCISFTQSHLIFLLLQYFLYNQNNISANDDIIKILKVDIILKILMIFPPVKQYRNHHQHHQISFYLVLPLFELYYHFSPSKFFTQILSVFYSLESDWLQISSDLHDSLTYPCRFYYCCSLDGFNFFSDFHFIKYLFHIGENRSKCSNYDWHSYSTIFFSFLPRFLYKSCISSSFIFIRWSTGTSKSTWGKIFFLRILGSVFWPSLHDLFIPQSPRESYKFHFQEHSHVCISIYQQSEVPVSCTIPSGSSSPLRCTCSCSSLLRSLITWLTVSFPSPHWQNLLFSCVLSIFCFDRICPNNIISFSYYHHHHQK